MPTVKALFEDISKRHASATAVNDFDTIKVCAHEFELLLNDAPGDIMVMFSLGSCKLQLGMNGSAIGLFQQCLEIKPDMPEIWNNLGTAWKGENNKEQAEICFRKALESKEDADYYNNMVTLHVNEGEPEKGIEYAEKGIALAPENPRLHWNYALLLLELGRWKDGLEHYEFGLLSNDRPNRKYEWDGVDVPWWDGQEGRVLVYGEQGMGDELMWASCLPDLIKQVGTENLVFECHGRLQGLLERSFPDVKHYGTRKEATIDWEDKVDYRVALGSLFRIYRSEGNFPKTEYLIPDMTLVTAYRNRLQALGPGPYIGIAWRAGHKRTNAKGRSLKLKEFVPLIEQGGTFVSLQYTSDAAGKIERFAEETGHTVHHWPEVVESHDGPDKETRKEYPGNDYDHTAALVTALDLCIIPNTAVAHLCGGLGEECWTLTPHAPAWRYGLTGTEMPMYGAWVQQYREGMGEVIEDYAAYLGAYAQYR